jgi:sulfite dehydrogenase (quinone) subunit SoeC
VHPAYSVIVFTTLSGAGYGLLAWLGIYATLGTLPADRRFGAAALALALGFITAGLLSSMLHLGHPERAWRALSQWRSSWLSREGVAAAATYVPALLFALGWLILGKTSGFWALLALLTTISALITVICTALIYQSLKPIPHWNNGWVLPNYVALAGMTGALWFDSVAQLFGLARFKAPMLGIITIAIALALKLSYWRFIDRIKSDSTAESATGLGHLGTVRLFEAPHTSDNYLMKEMGFHIGRKHATKLRWIALLLGFAIPFILSLIVLSTPGWIAATAAILAAVLAMLGVLVERWLFFAEAKHTVTLYYGDGQRQRPV